MIYMYVHIYDTSNTTYKQNRLTYIHPTTTVRLFLPATVHCHAHGGGTVVSLFPSAPRLFIIPVLQSAFWTCVRACGVREWVYVLEISSHPLPLYFLLLFVLFSLYNRIQYIYFYIICFLLLLYFGFLIPY